MKKITKIKENESVGTARKLQVAAYCRVSTANNEQLLSLEAQKAHYESYIKANSEWKFAGLYYDEGISGTKTAKREGLLAMMKDCERGRIDFVITKSISRFARNTTDCLGMVRRLLELNIPVYFEKENINTGSMESELMLSILSSMAESESVSISQNEKWSIRQRFKNGTYIISYPPYGYANVDGEMVIVPEQAEVVKGVFADTLVGKSTHAIADRLNADQVPSKRGGKWTPTSVNAILKNEKYTGDVIFQKTYTDSNFNRHKNYGEHDQYLCKDHHEPIISHEDYEKANEVLQQRGKEKGNGQDTAKYQNRYSFSGRIKCGECGSTLKRRMHYKPSGSYVAWCCAKHIEDKDACSMKYVTDEAIKTAFLTMMNKLRYGNDIVLKPLFGTIRSMNGEENNRRIAELDRQMSENQEQRQSAAGLLSKGYLDSAVFIKANNELLQKNEQMQSEKNLLLKMNGSAHSMGIELQKLIAFLNKSVRFVEFEDETFEQFVDSIMILSRRKIRFKLKCGLQLDERM